MTFQNLNPTEIAALLQSARTIAIVGLSHDSSRPSCEVATALLEFGYRIIPVNPNLQAWENIPALPTLGAAVATLAPDERIDIVDVFRKPRYVAAIVDDCLRLKLPALWLQRGVIDEAAAARARAAGMTVVMDKCLKVERMRI
jgi:predicted CoA-binding protein